LASTTVVFKLCVHGLFGRPGRHSHTVDEALDEPGAPGAAAVDEVGELADVVEVVDVVDDFLLLDEQPATSSTAAMTARIRRDRWRTSAYATPLG
jgi:hypothetical protein